MPIARSVLRHFFRPTYYALKKIPYRDHLSELSELQWLPADELQNRTFAKLKRIVSWVEKNNEYYSRAFQEANVSSSDLRHIDDFSRFPLLEKSALSELAQCCRQMPDEDLRHTTGSTGTPSCVRACRNAQAASFAARGLCLDWYQEKLGAGEGRFSLRPSGAHAVKDKVRNLLLNRLVLDTYDLQTSTLAESVVKIRKFRPDYLWGYATFLLSMALYLEKENENFQDLDLSVAVTTAEMSSDADRKRMSEVFGCPVADEYGCSEVEIVAFECPAGGKHLIAGNIHLECIPVPGQPGLGEYVVTDFHNFAMPLIRYRLGDLGRLSPDTCSCGRSWPLLDKFQGRSSKQYMTDLEGRKIHMSVFAAFLNHDQEQGLPLKQFQLVQETQDRFVLTLALDDDEYFHSQDFAPRWREFLCRSLGGEIDSNVEIVERIPHDQQKKFAFFVNNYDGGDRSGA